MIERAGRRCGSRALVGACLALASAAAAALPFTLTPSAATVQAGDTLSVTLSYESAATPIDFSLDLTSLTAAFSSAGTLTLDALVPLDAGVFPPVVNPTLPGALPVTANASIFGPLGGAGAAVDLLRFDFTVGAASLDGDLLLTATGGSFDAATFDPVPLAATAQVRIEAAPAAVPEPGTLGGLLLGGLAAAWIRRRRSPRA